MQKIDSNGVFVYFFMRYIAFRTFTPQTMKLPPKLTKITPQHILPGRHLCIRHEFDKKNK